MYNESKVWLRNLIIILLAILITSAIICGIKLIIFQNKVPDEPILVEEDKSAEYYNPDWGIIEEPEQIMILFTTSFDYVQYKPTLFLKVMNADLSRVFIDGRLRVDLNGEIYWIRLEKDRYLPYMPMVD